MGQYVISGNCTLYKGDQSNLEFLQYFLNKTGGNFDVILDDGSHLPAHNRFCFETLWPSIKDGGWYFIEDVETSYWKESVNGWRGQISTVEHFKLVADVVNKKFMGGKSPFPKLYNDIAMVFFGMNMIGMRKMTQWERKLTSGTYRQMAQAGGKPLPYKNPYSVIF